MTTLVDWLRDPSPTSHQLPKVEFEISQPLWTKGWSAESLGMPGLLSDSWICDRGIASTQCPPLISRLRSQPDRLSIAMTMRMMSRM